MRVAMAACMTKLLRALPALVAVLALASSAHAEDSISPSSSNESAEKSDGLELTLGLGAGDISTGAPDWSTHRGVSAGLSALFFTESGHGFGLRGTVISDKILWSGVSTNAVDAVYAFRPWQAHGTFSVVPTFWIGGGWFGASQYSGGLFEDTKVKNASAVTATGGVALDLHIKHFVVGVEGNARTALVGDQELRGAVGWNAMLHAGGEINF
ncbi:MAG: hypothetical protein ACXWP4_13190 [Polyangiales bacterium]